MKTQISRDTFTPEQDYSGVYLQQGRMILDADWNELTDIQKAQLVSALRDAISGSGGIPGGAPRDGGLKILADPAGSANVYIQPGALYVEGVPARINGLKSIKVKVNEQTEYPIPLQNSSSYSGKSLKLYADVWERSVTALEQSSLMDAALHGADTATRSQTMLQVKWCQTTVDPMKPADNPSIGNAPLKLKLRLVDSSGDPCDPCASQVSVDERIGNYLFRVEVHDYDASSKTLTLKWSRDNGAEACVVARMPDGFDEGDWVWEYFDDKTEKLLGNHFASGIDTNKLRGRLQTSSTTPSSSYPNTYLRQWDGYIKIKLDTYVLSEGRDRGVDLYKGTADDESHGRVLLDAGVLKINLELMDFELAVSQSGAYYSFVAGDYWLAPVREAVDESGDYVLGNASAGEGPDGIRHHYLFLGELKSDGTLANQNDAYIRRMNFPPLTDIHAADVAFTEKCHNLYNGAVNVQQALDNLCDIDADDVAYFMPNCGTNEGKAIKNRLASSLDPDSDGKLTVKVALDNLLCKLNAASLPYDVPACSSSPNVRGMLGLVAGDNNVGPVLTKLLCELAASTLPYTLPSCPSNPDVFTLLGLTSADNNVGAILNKLLCGFNAKNVPLDKTDPELCSDLQVDGAETVQDALKILCNKSGGGCSVAVSSSEQLELLLDNFAGNDEPNLWLCLKAGTYPITKDIVIVGKAGLRISGQGAETTAITFSGNSLSVEADEVILENVAIDIETEQGQLAIAATTSHARGCHFSRTTLDTGYQAPVSVRGQSGGTCAMSWLDNRLLSQAKIRHGNEIKWAGADMTGDIKVTDAMFKLIGDEVLLSETLYARALNSAVTIVGKMAIEARLAWARKLNDTKDSLLSPIQERQVLNVINALSDTKVSLLQLMKALSTMASFWVYTKSDYALRLEDNQVGGRIEGNHIDGYLLLGNGIEGYSDILPGSIGFVSLSGNVVESGGEDLHLSANTITAIYGNANIDSTSGDIKEQVAAHGGITLTNNRIEGQYNVITAASLSLSGNYLRGNYYDSSADKSCYCITDRAIFTGNINKDSNAANFICQAWKDAVIVSANINLTAYGTRIS